MQLRKLHYNGHNEEWLQSEFNEIQMTIQAEKAITAPGWMVMFRVPQWRTRLMHATLIQVFTQMTGINVIGYYQTIIYTDLGITGGRNLLVTGIYNCVGPIASTYSRLCVHANLTLTVPHRPFLHHLHP
jgi:hypothetical protein